MTETATRMERLEQEYAQCKGVLARATEDDAVIREGLKGGEKIVLDGHSRLGPGAKVEIKRGLNPSLLDKVPTKAELTVVP